MSTVLPMSMDEEPSFTLTAVRGRKRVICRRMKQIHVSFYMYKQPQTNTIQVNANYMYK